ncbi:hypothetical protein NA57DRAFT_46246 [Rhizodiscina lignyota]|uniref:Mediator of RNA polymerase II transcription subunit 16 n=1 Tax=Rhizodiscina lignyota TaxID=1504668 RepID=A0A9P4M2B0_9PEZI|nr:hypothetical protein NA57DRAFT_46246 [Rhizodiscina lignyota]
MDQQTLEQQVIGAQNLDHDINMEDLFGAEPVVPVNLPVDKRLPRRLSEMHESGCCQRIGWSRYGPIASINPDSRGVKAACLIRDTKSGRWRLSESMPLKLPEGSDSRFKHVSWSYVGSDLAVVDTLGRLLIYNCALGHAHLDLRKDCGADSNDEMSSIVGMHWLPQYSQAGKVTAFWSATLDSGRWSWNRDEHRGTGPFNPNDGKTALFCITRAGRLRLLYQGGDGHWRECTALVDNEAFDTERYITHASFAPDRDDGLQLVTYDTHQTLRLYKIKVAWGVTKDQQDPTGKNFILNPSLTFKALYIEPYCVPDGMDPADPTDMTGLGAADGIQYMLTHLEMIQPALDTGAQEQSVNSILAVYKNVPSILPAPSGGAQPASLAPSSVVWTWQLQPATTGSLSASFDQLSAKKKGTDSARLTSTSIIVKQAPNTFHNAILSVTSLRYNTIIALTMADGSAEFLRRDSMQPIQADYNFTEVYSLPQSGFAFVSMDPIINIELSPSGSMQAFHDSEGILKVRTMTSTVYDLANPVDAERRTAAATVLALQWASGLLQFRSFLDDILALIVPNSDAELAIEFIEQCVAATGYNLDFSSDEPQKPTLLLFRTPWIQKLLGAQAALGLGKSSKRTLSAKMAFVTLNLRLAAFVIMMHVKSRILPPCANVNLVTEVAVSLIGIVQWTLDFMLYCLQEIDRISEELHNNPTADPRTVITNYITRENSPALLLLFSSISRVLIRMIGRPLRHGWIHCINNGTKANATQKDKQAFPPSSVPAIAFENFSGQVDILVKEAYAAGKISGSNEESAYARAKAEREMFVRARIPDVMLPAVVKLLKETWPKFIQAPGIDLGRIVKHDIAWLGFTEDRYTKMWQARHTVDVVRKIVLPNSAKVRRCTRCNSGMEDIVPGEKFPAWVIGSMKNCICLGNWGATGGEDE